MSEERKTIDQITRTLTSFLGTEYIPGRDGTGDFKATVASLVLYATAGGTKKEIDNADETILDTDVYKLYTFDNLGTDRNLNLPTLADNDGKEIYVVNLDGSYNVNVIPEGSDYINDWNVAFPITERYGILKIVALSDRWLVTPLNDACIYEVSSETGDTGLALDGSWDDVTAMTLLNGIYGAGWLSANVTQTLDDTSQYLKCYFGIGNITGDNEPNVWHDYLDEVYAASEDALRRRYVRRIIPEFEYQSDGTPLYMKSRVLTDKLDVLSHACRGSTNHPMYIRWRRIY